MYTDGYSACRHQSFGSAGHLEASPLRSGSSLSGANAARRAEEFRQDVEIRCLRTFLRRLCTTPRSFALFSLRCVQPSKLTRRSCPLCLASGCNRWTFQLSPPLVRVRLEPVLLLLSLRHTLRSRRPLRPRSFALPLRSLQLQPPLRSFPPLRLRTQWTTFLFTSLPLRCRLPLRKLPPRLPTNRWSSSSNLRRASNPSRLHLRARVSSMMPWTRTRWSMQQTQPLLLQPLLSSPRSVRRGPSRTGSTLIKLRPAIMISRQRRLLLNQRRRHRRLILTCLSSSSMRICWIPPSRSSTPSMLAKM